jgi:tetratricopeptide (TPR) repeat protein/predicted Ser/Thr protein kinase
MAIPPTSEIQSGALLAGRYRMVDRLGAGGMAVVYLAQDTVLDRMVAVKRLHATAPKDGAERFIREAKLGASLNHPNLVTVFDTVSDEEELLIVMEYVSGRSLSTLIERGPLDPGRAMTVLEGVAEGLDHAHAHGVVHRDVKPANVLIRDDGVVKLADLGVATAAHVSRITTATDIVGTLAYIAPERLEGGENDGPAADIYSLAAVAFEALSGRRAQRETNPLEALNAASNGPPPDLREAWAAAPARTAEVLQRGLSADPGARPGSASELVRELQNSLAPAAPSGATAAAPTAAPPAAPRTTEVTLNVRRPGRILAIVALVSAVAVAAVVTGISLSGGDGSDADRPAASNAPGNDNGTGSESSPQDGGPSAAGDAAGGEPTGGEPEGADPVTAATLNDEGFGLIQQGRYEEAVPVLERAVSSFPEGTDDLNYAYALYNLGNALRLSGHPEEAVPILEQRLAIPNQRGTVKRELEAARAQAAE